MGLGQVVQRTDGVHGSSKQMYLQIDVHEVFIFRCLPFPAIRQLIT